MNAGGINGWWLLPKRSKNFMKLTVFRKNLLIFSVICVIIKMQNSGLQASEDVYRILQVYLFAYISRWVPLSPDGLFFMRWLDGN